MTQFNQLPELLGEADWMFDMGEGTMTFTAQDGYQIVSECQVLGTESMQS